jgi:hypothetical protein
MSVSIIRAPRPERDFTIVSNAVAQDARLSYRARGVLLAILSRPDGWRTDSEQLAKEGREGRDAIRAALRELEAAGYVDRKRVRVKDARGRLVWHTEVWVRDTPDSDKSTTGQPVDHKPAGRSDDGFPGVGNPGVGNPGVGNPGVGNPGPKELKTDTKTDQTPVAPADAGGDGATGGGELDLGIDPAQAPGPSPAQALVGAYADAYRASGGRPTKAVLGACGKNVKRLIDQDHIDPPVLLQAVKRAGAARSKDLDRHLGEAQQAYGRPAARKAMFDAWDANVARFTPATTQPQIGA